MAQVLYSSCTGTSHIISVSVSDSHVAPTSTAIVVAESTSLSIGDSVTIRLGYVGNHDRVFTGYVKNIELKEPERVYTITAANVLIRAVDFFIASSDPNAPFSRRNITAEDLIEDLLRLSGLTSFDMENTSFTFAIRNPVEVNLTGCYDYCKFLADIIAYTLYADNDGTVHLINRRPYPVGSEPADYDFDTNTNIIEIAYERSDHDIRNKVIVYGSGDIHATAQATSPYLPPGFFRTVVVAAPGVIDSQSMASQSATYNLQLLNRLTQKLHITIEGQPEITPRTIGVISNTALGLSNQKFYLYSVEHNWSKAGYLTNIEGRW